MAKTEDNRSWEYLAVTRDFYAKAAPKAATPQRELAREEILIAEGSDWNWWYGPEHHSAHDREFDELYRKHLSNAYQALGAAPPEFLAQPIAAGVARPWFVPQTAYIHPRIEGEFARYFDWLGAAMYTADRHAGSMHGKQFLLDAAYAGLDESALYGRLDFAGGVVPADEFRLVVNCESIEKSVGAAGESKLRLEAWVADEALAQWSLGKVGQKRAIAGSDATRDDVKVKLLRNFEFKLPLQLLRVVQGNTVRLRFTLWRDHLPLDALPLEGWIELRVAPEWDLQADLYNYSANS